MNLHDILKQVAEHKASDVHFKVGEVPVVRLLNGILYRPDNTPKIEEKEILDLINIVCPQHKLEKWKAKDEIDLAYSIDGVSRFRVNVYNDYRGPCMAFRVVPHEIPKFDDLFLPEIIRNFCDLKKGLVLITGPTGSGKSTTLAALIDIINQKRACHIITIEDPIEFLHENKKSIITQRELGLNTNSFVSAIRSALREDPDVIMVGEMRDKETISAALTLAETGHLVFSTVHTVDAVQTIDRIIGVFPAEQQPQIRSQLVGTLQGVLSQTLLSSNENLKRTLICEIMLVNSGIRNCIKENKIEQIYSMMQIGKKEGMQTYNDALQALQINA
jgi:twitching motility protein PilT